ncbi:NAD-dependent epimerase/dehydratase family protein [Pedobacter aquatilis]|uniref:NAD-dependent epimerase/dehydratase family protein n=1 Tax=Pedobacter aquatilis TaxID=351343 RepID=UPI0025B3B80B|nr:NAD-dependent epimerase/dehydratase family protein [Pedobacter aquatilis]MDN3587278.1 NAD-dependent epimerase/dehydratase family protein [Pedobacter aquatilis]
MIIAITGATGFIGRILVDNCLALGHEVRVLTRKFNHGFSTKVLIFNSDLLDAPEKLAPFLSNVDVLYHCAAEIRNEELMRKVNVEGTANLIEAAKGKVKHWVQLSSTGVYGPVFRGVIDENSQLKPANAYEVSKVESDLLVLAASEKQIFTISIVRPSNVFGPTMINRSLFQLIKTIEKGQFFFIGPKGANANYVHVTNVIDVLLKAGTHPNAIGSTYNISDYLPLDKFVDIIACQLKVKAPKLRIPLFIMNFIGLIGDYIPKSPIKSSRVNALTNRVTYTNQKVETQLGYRTITSVEEGIVELVRAFRKQI